MPQRFEPKSDVLPQAQREIWPQLAAVPKLSFVLYGGTAVALQLGHRQSLDFDLFCAEPLDKARLANIAFVRNAQVIQEEPQTLVVSARTASQPVRISFFGAITIGHVNPPSQTADEVLLVASLEDLMATN
jgi:predicted nucleotidyltransferase